MQTNKTFIISEPTFLNIMPEVKVASVVAHVCQTPGALHFYASDVCIFCHEHRIPWGPMMGEAATPSQAVSPAVRAGR